MRVYKFLEKKWALAALRDKRLKIGRWTGLNDPFDLLPFAAAEADRVRRLSLAITLAEMNTRAGWVCFSRTWSNPIIWAHYAEQHNGLAWALTFLRAPASRYAMSKSARPSQISIRSAKRRS